MLDQQPHHGALALQEPPYTQPVYTENGEAFCGLSRVNGAPADADDS
jgi:hypothetical protein